MRASSSQIIWCCEEEISWNEDYGAVPFNPAALSMSMMFTPLSLTRPQAALNWEVMPIDLPLDVWVLQYEKFQADAAVQWLSAGKEQFHYVSESSPMLYSNADRRTPISFVLILTCLPSIV